MQGRNGLWRRWLQLGTGLMGFAPEAFWRLSLVEWQALAEGFALRAGPPRGMPLSRAELRSLAAQFPDEEKRN